MHSATNQVPPVGNDLGQVGDSSARVERISKETCKDDESGKSVMTCDNCGRELPMSMRSNFLAVRIVDFVSLPLNVFTLKRLLRNS